MAVPVPHLLLTAAALLAQVSPWWEQYETSERFLCPRLGAVQLERNNAQASLISGGSRTTAFRDDSPLPGIRYVNPRMTLIVQGDLLTIEQLPSRIQCTRTERV
ncbi:MAG: hypothetical protein MUD04_03555 [Cyanobium sp. Prado107]|jgi:hypothetical protein|nr:hypothetical protein [Cyanobium sp. Prado107]